MSDAKPPPSLRLVADEANRESSARGISAVGAAGERSDFEFAQLYRRYAPYVAAIAGRIVGRDSDLDDLVQDVFVDAARGLAALREPSAIKGWLAKIAVRRAVRHLRRRRMRKLLGFEGTPFEPDCLLAPGASAEEWALISRVYRALSKMPANQQVAWVLRNIQGETLQSGAMLCECSLSTYQRRLRLASEALAQELGHD